MGVCKSNNIPTKINELERQRIINFLSIKIIKRLKKIGKYNNNNNYKELLKHIESLKEFDNLHDLIILFYESEYFEYLLIKNDNLKYKIHLKNKSKNYYSQLEYKITCKNKFVVHGENGRNYECYGSYQDIKQNSEYGDIILPILCLLNICEIDNHELDEYLKNKPFQFSCLFEKMKIPIDLLENLKLNLYNQIENLEKKIIINDELIKKKIKIKEETNNEITENQNDIKLLEKKIDALFKEINNLSVIEEEKITEYKNEKNKYNELTNTTSLLQNKYVICNRELEEYNSTIDVCKKELELLKKLKKITDFTIIIYDSNNTNQNANTNTNINYAMKNNQSNNDINVLPSAPVEIIHTYNFCGVELVEN